ncbi:MAG: DUF3267 domain-containing protein [Alkaliphilus sp.]|nr:DUF3267 domain-containing protein [Alkaliphilus sp.]
MNWTITNLKYSKLKLILIFLTIYHTFEYAINEFGISFEEISILTRLLITIPVIILHELVHGATFALFLKSTRSVRFGFEPKYFVIYCQANGEYSFQKLITSTLAPLILLTLVLGLVLFSLGITSPLMWMFVFYNTFMSTLDIYNVILISKTYKTTTMFKLEGFKLYYKELVMDNEQYEL